MRFLTLLPVTFALAFVLALAWGASAQDGPLLPPDDPTPAPPVTTPAPRPSPPPASPTPRPETPTPAPTEPADPTPELATPEPTPEPVTPEPPSEPAEPAKPTEPSEPAIPWAPIWTPDGAWMGVVLSESLNIRQAPALDAPVVGTTWAGHLVHVNAEVTGDTVDGVPTWYRVGPEQYVSAALVEPFVPPAPEAVYDGHWVDIDLGAFYAVAYDGSTPVYAAIVRTGRPGYETPTGAFTIFHRVASETMDAGTLGVQPGDPEYYYIEDVPHTQYFAAGGYALHGNSWTSPTAFGASGSHGCVNLLPADAAWLWDFLGYGSVVSVHP